METGTIKNNNAILMKLFRDAFIVMCLMELLNSAASITDSYFIGNFIGSKGIAAMGLARPFYSFTDIICGPLGLGMQLICSRYIGKCEFDRAQKTFSGSLLLGMMISLPLLIVGFTNASMFASMYGVGNGNDEIIPLADMYLKGLFIGVPAMIVQGTLLPIVQLGSGKKLITFSIIAQLVADVIGDALSVFVFDGGLFGLGLATAVSYYASLIPLFLYFARKDAILKLKLTFMPASDLKLIYNAGASKAIKRICNTVKPIVLNQLALIFGTALALSAYSITSQVRDLMISFSASISSAVILIGSLLYGQRDRSGLNTLARISFKAMGFIVLLSGLCIALAGPIARFFISDSDEVTQMAALSIRCVGIMIPFSTFNGVYISFMQVTGRMKLTKILSYLNRLIFIVITSAVLGKLFGTVGLWWALPISEMLNAIVSVLIVRSIRGKFPHKIEDMLCLEPDFGYRPEDYIEISLKTIDDVISLQSSVKRFCSNHGIDDRRSVFTQLALEELTVNVIEHGFPRCKHDPHIHIWITYENGDMFLRIQDNCPDFNVMKYCSRLQEMSRERCVGLRLVSKISKEMSYVNSLGTNNLIISI